MLLKLLDQLAVLRPTYAALPDDDLLKLRCKAFVRELSQMRSTAIIPIEMMATLEGLLTELEEHRDTPDPLFHISHLYRIKIDKDVPIPRQAYKRSTMKDKVSHVKVGDSFLIPYSRSSVAGNLARGTGWKWCQRRDPENSTKMRIWRTG